MMIIFPYWKTKMSKFAQYEAFVAIVKTGSISVAADSLNRTPSAISKQIANLESDLGVQLFDRSNKKMAPTPHGSQFFQSSSAILRQIYEAESQVLQDKETITGEIKITLSKSLIGSELITYLNEFSEQYPHTQYDLQFGEKIEDFNESDLDFAFRIGNISDNTRLIASPLIDVTPIFYATPKYVSNYGKPRTIKELSNHRIILPPLENLSSDLRLWLKKYNFIFPNKTRHKIDDIGAIQDMVLNHGGIGINLKYSLQNLLSRKLIVSFFPNQTLPSKKLYLIYRKARYQSAQLEAFKNFIKEKFK